MSTPLSVTMACGRRLENLTALEREETMDRLHQMKTWPEICESAAKADRLPLPGKPQHNVGDEWRTPRWLFDRLHCEFAFDTDAAATAENALCPNYWTKEEDGLIQSWAGYRVYCNPPYSDIGPWVAKAWTATQLGGCTLAVLLVPARVQMEWFHDYCTVPACEVRFLAERVRFDVPDGTDNPMRPFEASLIAVFRPAWWSDRGQIADLKRMSRGQQPVNLPRVAWAGSRH